MMVELRFSENWNNKLNNTHFTTIRLSRDYWKQFVGHSVKIFLNAEEIGVACLYYVDPNVPFRDIDIWFVEYDTGMDYTTAFNFFRRMYKNRKEWQGLDTKFDILFFYWEERY